MNWKMIAVEKLKDYGAKKAGVQNLSEEIREVEQRRRSIRSATSDGTAVSGGGSRREDVMLNSIAHQAEMEENLLVTEAWIKRVERGLAELSEDEQAILSRFYIHPEKGAAERLAMDLGIDVKTVYHRKDKALRKFTLALCGVVDS